MKKSVLSLFLTLCIAAFVIAALPISADAASSGTCGDNLTWTLDDEGTLTISGTGEVNSSPWNKSSVKTVIIQNGVASIGSVFYYCTNLTNVNIPDSVTSISNYAFDDCSSLTSINVNDGNSYYSSLDGNLYNKDKTCLIRYATGKKDTYFSIPSSVTSIGYYAFSGCASLTSISIPDSVTSIDDAAFFKFRSLTGINIPDSVTIIGEGAFSGCSSLTTVNIPNSVTSIGNRVFSDCTDLTSVNIPDSVTYIGHNAFYGCSSLTSVNIPNSVTYIGERAFNACSSLTSINIPNSVTSINSYAFSDCTDLTSVNIPDSITSIGSYAFSNCSSLTSISIPNRVNSIDDYAFYGCSSLTSVNIPDSVTSIGKRVFSGCSSLTSVNIPYSVTSIDQYAFSSCKSLTSINVNDGNSYYSSLDGNLYNKDKTCLIQYAIGKKDTYFSIPSSVTYIKGAFQYCSSLTSVNIPESVTSIGDSAFTRCSSLTSVNIPDSVTYIGHNAFYGCDNLKDVYYSGSAEQWKNISIGSGDDCLTDAAIHYNCGKLPGDDGNTNNPAEISANTVHSLPAGINDSIKINKTGKGYAYFILRDSNGNLYSNRSYRYKIIGNDNSEYIGKTDINGIACVATATMNLNGGKAADKTCTVEFLNDDLQQKTFTINVTLAPISYKESWTGKATYGANIGAKLGAGGSLKGANGSLGAEAELASVGVTGKNTKVITIENIYKDGVRDLHLSSSEDKNAAVNAKLGMYAGAGNAANLSLGSVSGDISSGYTLGRGFYIKNYDPDNAAQRQQIELFLMDTAMGLDGSNVIPRMLFNYWLSKNGMTASNEQNYKVSVMSKLGASAPSIKLGNFSTSVAGMNADALYEFSSAVDHENKTTTSTKTKVSENFKLFNSSYKASADKNDFSIKTGSAIYNKQLINNSIQFSATTGENGVEKISFKTAEDANVSSVFSEKSSAEFYKNITYKDASAKKLVSGNSFMNYIANGNFGFFTIKSAQSVANDMAAGKYPGEYTREKEVSEEFGKTINFGIDKTLGMEFGLTGIHKYSYTSQTGVIKDGYEYLKSAGNIDEAIAVHSESLMETLDKIARGMKSDFQSALSSITKPITDGLNWMKVHINGAGEWVVTVTGFKKDKIGLQSFAIMSVNDESEAIENASVSHTVGEPYVIAVKDADGNEIADFGANPLNLSLSFDKDDFTAAEVSFSDAMKQNLKIYRWNDEKGVYVCIGGIADTVNNRVSANVSKPGQYILAIDNCPPSVTDFKVSDTGSTPTITANISDMSGIAEFSFKLDGKELADSDTWEKFYNSASGTFSYKVTEPLEDNTEHTAEITAGDSSGNKMEKAAVLTFTVDTLPPVITSVGVPDISLEDTLRVTAEAQDSNLSNMIAVIGYAGEDFSYPMTEENGVWSAEISGMPKFARLTVTVKAYDIAGNCTASETKNAIMANNQTESVYIGVLDYSGKNADIIINNTTDQKVNAIIEINGYDGENSLIETKRENIELENGYITKIIALDNDCRKIRAELLKAEDEEQKICMGFSAYLNEKTDSEETVYTVTLIDGESKTVMSYDEFNSYTVPSKDGYIFYGWYLSSDFDPLLKVEKLTADYGSSVTLYGKFTKITELLRADIESVSCRYDNNKLTAEIKFNYIDQSGTLYLAVYDKDRLVTAKSVPVTADSADCVIELDADDSCKNYTVKVFLWDDNSPLKPIAKSAETKISAAASAQSESSASDR